MVKIIKNYYCVDYEITKINYEMQTKKINFLINKHK